MREILQMMIDDYNELPPTAHHSPMAYSLEKYIGMMADRLDIPLEWGTGTAGLLFYKTVRTNIREDTMGLRELLKDFEASDLYEHLKSRLCRWDMAKRLALDLDVKTHQYWVDNIRWCEAQWEVYKMILEDITGQKFELDWTDEGVRVRAGLEEVWFFRRESE